MRLIVVAVMSLLVACERPGAPSPPGAPLSPSEVEPGTPPAAAASPLTFCWTNAPQGAWLNALWANAPDDAWVVGSPGVALRWDGSSWSRPKLSTTASFRSVWAGARDDVWLLASDGAVLRGDGLRFTQTLAAGPARGWIRGLGPGDVWAGDDHWDGQQWTRHPLLPAAPAAWHDVRVVPLGSGEAFGLYSPYPADPRRRCARFDGASWTEEPCPGPGTAPAGDIALVPWSSGNGDLYVAGAALGSSQSPEAEPEVRVGQWLARWDGAGWTYDGLPTTDRPTDPVLTGTGPQDLWFGAPSHRLQGSAWAAISPPDGDASEAAATSAGVFVLNGAGQTRSGAGDLAPAATRVSFGDGTTWRELLDVGPQVLVAGQVGGRRVGVAADGIAEFDGQRWATVARAQAPFENLDEQSRLFGEATDDFWIVRFGDSSAYHWDGEGWSTMAYPGDGRFWSAGDAANGRVWFIGEESTEAGGVIAQRFRLLVLDPGASLAPVAELGEDDVWAVRAFESGETLAFASRRSGAGDGLWSRVLWRHDGASWSVVWEDEPTGEAGWSPLAGVAHPDDVWAFANAPSTGEGLIQRDLLQWDGTTMRRVARLRGEEGAVAAVVQRGEAWLSDGVEDTRGTVTTFRRARSGGVDADAAAVLPARARQLWTTPDGRVFALSDLGAEWEARAACR